jgi:hypothetical protein
VIESTLELQRPAVTVKGETLARDTKQIVSEIKNQAEKKNFCPAGIIDDDTINGD